ncbi:NlpB/DapX family lipoprotein [Thioalkalivibrio denitrificans]|uniref:NlpB/DapX family lipoprotein n=1 Tax=Thioalkalivibrio denitrificans TaxID=108003 RepID=A0A1V3NDE1_9GAMM|nr:outer membrane protein assembly factor BamC [Thioalkalivibrio denitrificans]OOG23117.1 NlpB/DapX family lipoprotein [Thioalkalivibrio denitrificans]
MQAKPLSSVSLAGILVPVLVISLAGCGMLGDRRDTAHEGAQSGRALEIPPDLLPPELDATYRVPPREDGRVSAVEAERRQQQPSGILGAAPAPDVTADRVALREIGEMSVRREGSIRWLEVRAAPDELWQGLRSFWRDQGFDLVRDEPAVGVMETDWKESEAGVDIGEFRAALGRVLGTRHDAGYQDKFRVRLERDDDGLTSVFIAHRGVEQTVDDPQVGGIRWAMRPADPNLEAEMLTRLMVFLGRDEDEVRGIVDHVADTGPSVRERQVDGEPVLEMRGEYTRVWRQVGLSLDRAGLLVDDQDRRNGIFHVTYSPHVTGSRGGVFARMFRRDPVGGDGRYQIRLVQDDSWVRITARDREGEPLRTGDARTVLELLRDEIR